MLLGVLTIVLLGSQTVAAWVRLPGDLVLERLERGEDYDLAMLEHLTHSRERALEFAGRASDLDELGTAALLHAELIEDEAARLADLERAARFFEASLERHPARTRVWLRLARARAGLGDPAGAIEALRTAWILAPYDPRATALRVDLGFALWDTLGDSDRERVLSEAEEFWRRFGGLRSVANRRELLLESAYRRGRVAELLLGLEVPAAEIEAAAGRYLRRRSETQPGG